MIRLADPWFLAFLVLLPLAWFLRRRFVRPGLRYPLFSPASWKGDLRRGWGARVVALLPLLKYLALALLVLALARPQLGVRQTRVTTEGVNIILAVDVSESMAAMDFTLNGSPAERLTAVKKVVADFVAGRSGDRIGLVVFGTEAYTQAPLTADYGVVLQVLDRVKRGSAGPNTAIGDAVGISLKRLKDVESASNVIILLTDGRSNSGELPPEASAELAAERGVRIYTIGAGTRGEAPFVVDTPLGDRVVYRQVDIDEKTLRRMAEKTGGLYFRAEDTEGLRTIYETIDELEKTEVEMMAFDSFDDLYAWPAGAALALLLLWVLGVGTRLARLP